MRRGFLFFSIFLIGIFYLPKNSLALNSDIIINEIGAYEADGHEWIEIYNKGNEAIDITGWKFYENGTNHGLDLYQGDDMIIESNEYAVIVDVADNFVIDYPNFSGTIIDSSWTTLSESGELIELRVSSDPESVIESFAYLEATNFSLERIDPGLNDYTLTNWLEHSFGNTVGVINSNYLNLSINQPPTAVIGNDQEIEIGEIVYFDGGGSYDSDGEIISYNWNFGDGNNSNNATTSHIYLIEGVFDISLTVTDDKNATGTDNLVVTVTNNSTTTPTSTPVIINPSDVVINEFVADPISGENEWIELYNNTTSTINLSECFLEDGVGLIYSLDGDISPNDFLVIDLSVSKLNNIGDKIILKDNNEQIIDQVVYGNWDEGDTENNVPSASDPYSVARNIDGLDSDLDVDDFSLTTTVTKGIANVITAIPENPPATGGGGGRSLVTKYYDASDIVINELVSDPEDDESEWIELYNNTSKSIDLSDWKIEDGSESVTDLSGTILSRGFIVIESIRGNLNNTGDLIILKDPRGNEIDSVCYGNWDNGNLVNNAPKTNEPYSLIRRIDGQDTNNDFDDFVITSIKTPNSSNIVSLLSEDEELVEGDFSKQVVINEIMPNPKGSDVEEEFIELKNIGDQEIDLFGWVLSDGSSKKYTITSDDFDSLMIEAGKFFVIKRSQSGLALNNSGVEFINLYWPNGTLIDNKEYSGKVKEDYSYSRDESGEFFWTNQVTSNQENIITRENQSPVAVISIDSNTIESKETINFDASDSFDLDNDELFYKWDFGDGSIGEGIVVSHQYDSDGIYQVFLTVVDEMNSSDTIEKIIYVGDVEILTDNFNTYNTFGVFISEVFPNPEGVDADTEFVELFNSSNQSIDLSGWQLDDIDGGSKPYKIENKIIGPGEYLVFTREETRLALNNNFDSVRLMNGRREIVDSVDYDGAKEGISFAMDENYGWSWTTNVTPGKKNILVMDLSTKSKSKNQIFEISLKEVRDLENGDKVKVNGIVSVEPGILGTQIFYLAGSGIQIYFSKKDFPDLNVGDYLEITGELSEVGGERRIKISQKEDIKIINQKLEDDLVSHEIMIGEVGEEYEGSLVKISGEIIEIRGSNIYLDDDGEEVKVYIKSSTGIKVKDLEITEGDGLIVIGIVSQTKDGYRILPRYKDDIIKIAGEVLGEAEEVMVTTGDNKINNYLIAVIVFMGGVIGWQVWQQNKLIKRIDNK